MTTRTPKTKEERVALPSGPGFGAALATVRARGRVYALEVGATNGQWVACVYVPDGFEDEPTTKASKKGVMGKQL